LFGGYYTLDMSSQRRSLDETKSAGRKPRTPRGRTDLGTGNRVARRFGRLL